MAETCGPARPLEPAIATAAAHDANALTFSLFRAVSCKAENVAVSGFVARHAMGTLAAASPAHEEMWRSLGYQGSERAGRAELDAWKAASGGVTYTSGARVFYEQSLHLDPAFEKRSADAFAQRFESLDFKRRPEKTREQIGKWVAETSGGQLTGPVPKELVGDDTVLVVGTAFGLEASWERPFDRSTTKQAVFTQRSGEARPVPMMSQLTPADYGTSDGVQLLDLRLGALDGRLSVLFVLPPLGTPLETIERGLDRATYQQWLLRLRAEVVHCAIPRFKAETLLDVSSALKALAGLELDAAHVFAGVSEAPPVRLVHQTTVTVDESGVKATASSVGAFSTAADGEAMPSFVADRPFLFVIRDRESPGSPVLLIGRVGKP